MTRRTEISWLKDIHLSIEKIEQHPQYKNGRQGYDADEYFRGWVYLHVERICEAATHLCNEYHYDEKHPELPWRNIVGTRIVLAHCYWNIEEDVLWNVVAQHLPLLKAKIGEWLQLKEPLP